MSDKQSLLLRNKQKAFTVILLLGEQLTPGLIVGGTLALLGIFLTTSKQGII